MGGASVGLASDCDNTLANFNEETQEIKSQAFNINPKMMFNTVHGGMYRQIEPDIIDNSMDQD